jgi:hypothetical protein
MLAIGLAISAASAGASAIGSVKAGNASKRAGQAEADVANSQADLSLANADLADQQAADAEARGAVAENEYRTQVRGLIGSQRAGFAANGVDVGFGSSVDVQADAARLGELDALTIRSNAAREAWGYKVQAWNDRQSSLIQRKGGQMAIEAGKASASADYWNAGQTLLTGAGGLLMQKYGKK